MTVNARREALFIHHLQDFDPILPDFPLPELAGQRIFGTGGSGFIGFWLLLACHWLNERGAGIRLTLLSRNPDAFLAKHPEFRTRPWLEWVSGDVKSYRWPDQSFDRFIHAAADTSPLAGKSPQLFDDIVVGTQHVIEHAAAAGARRLLLISSGAIYGEQPETLPRMAEDFPGQALALAPDDHYGRGKRAMETYARETAAGRNIELVIARCFSFVGFGLPGHLVISQFIADALAHDSLRINGDGQAVRSYLHAADLAVWLLALLARGQAGQVYNVGSPDPLSLLEVASLVRDTLAPASRIEVLNRVAAAPRQRYVPDTQHIEQKLRVNCWTPLESAIRNMAIAQRLEQQAAVGKTP
jgi:nucleoside-diphosphate-sugar epimerase